MKTYRGDSSEKRKETFEGGESDGVGTRGAHLASRVATGTRAHHKVFLDEGMAFRQASL